VRHGDLREPGKGSEAQGEAKELTGTKVRRVYLELREPSDLRPSRAAEVALRVERVSPCPTALYRTLYREVGERWYWRDRLVWSDDRLATHLARDGVAVFVARVGDEIAGYFELEQHDDGSVEIAYFGLRPQFFGRGLGGELLTRAAEEGWRMGAERVWLHTCSLDSPQALPNYVARGFRPFKEEWYTTDAAAEVPAAPGPR
jgi:ribosomal protein S18 acetylase RimI-like enzyme